MDSNYHNASSCLAEILTESEMVPTFLAMKTVNCYQLKESTEETR